MNSLLRIFSGSAHLSLTREICEYLHIPLGKMKVDRFADGEIEIQIEENIRGTDCFIIQPTCPPVNERLVELLLIVDAMVRASVHRITAVIPYYGYGRQDRKVEPRVPISAKLVANLLTAAGVDRVLSLDLHAGQIQGFFDIPVDHLYAMPVLLKYIKDKPANNFIVVSPDTGGVERAREFAKRLSCDLAVIDKRRPRPNQATVMNIIGDVKGMDTVIIDDLVDTAGTLVKVAQALNENGAKSVIAACTHLLLSGQARENLMSSCIQELIVTDSVPIAPAKMLPIIKVLPIAPLLGEAIHRIHHNESVNALFV